MLIDWFTIAAQIINFLILLWLLKRFLYKPVLNAMNEREKKITQRLADAETARQQARQQAEEYRTRTAELDTQRNSLLQEAQAEAEAFRKELFHQARQDASEIQERWQRSIQQEKEAFLRDLYQRATTQTYEIARKALTDLANKDLESHVIENFLLRIENLDSEEHASLDAALSEANGRVVVRSAFEIPPGMREKILAQLGAITPESFEVSYEALPEVSCGIELKMGGKKVAWSLASYLETLQEALAQAFQTRVQELDQVEANAPGE